MAIATWQDLCIDAVDAELLGRFWAEALGLTYVPHDDGDAQLDGPTPEHRVWINTVPEPVTVKQRVHIDVHAASVDDVLALGATPEDLDSFRWKVLHDPEGGELCVFERDEVPDYRVYEIVVDSVDPYSIARWWADALGGTYGEKVGEDEAWVEEIPGAPFDCIVFGTVPEPKTVKNRIHWDVVCSEVDALVARGATLLRAPDEEIFWHVLADPEGNEFCAFAPEEEPA
jgi:glyoxalase superfamily protein